MQSGPMRRSSVPMSTTGHGWRLLPAPGSSIRRRFRSIGISSTNAIRLKVPGRGPQAANLIDPLAKKAAKKNLGIGKSKADAADLPLWLEETGPTSCPGTNDTSLTNASALWAADYTLYAATLGVERMAMHSMLGRATGERRCH